MSRAGVQGALHEVLRTGALTAVARSARRGRAQGDVLPLANGMFALRLVGVLLSFLASVVAARVLVPADRGVLAVLIAVPSILSTLGIFGLDAANLSFAGRGGSSHRDVRRYSLAYALGAGSVVTVVATGLALLEPTATLGLSLPAFLVAALFTMPLLAVGLLTATEAGRGRALGATAITVASLGLYLLGMGLLVLTGNGDPFDLFLAFGASQLIVLGFLAARSVGDRAMGGPRVPVREYLGYAVRVNPSAILMLLLIRIQVPLLQVLAGATAVALYATAQPMAEVLLLVPTALTLVLLPRAANDAIGPRETRGLIRHALLVSVAAALAIGVAAPVAVPLLFGADYAGAVPVLLVLLPGVVALGTARVAQVYLLARRRFAVATLAAAGGLGLSVLLLIALTPEHGALGAALAATAGYLMTALITIVRVLPELRSEPDTPR